MRTHIALVTVLVLLPWSGTTRAGPGGPSQVEPLPTSLDSLYPPEADSKIYTHEMLELGRLMGTLAADLALPTRQAGAASGEASPSKSTKPRRVELRTPDTRASLEAFSEQYERVANLVPEWSGRFPEPVLDQDLSSSEGRHAAREALEEVGAACTACHISDLFVVQAQFHWPEFAAIEPAGADGTPVPFHRTMVELSNRMAAIPVAVERERWDDASVHHAELNRQFDLLKRSCSYCHATPRTYFVDEKVRAIVMFTGGMLRVKNADTAEYREKMMAIETQSCIPCHQLHMPAAYVQMQLAESDGR